MNLTTRELAMILASLRAVQTRMSIMHRQGIGKIKTKQLFRAHYPDYFIAVEPLSIIEIDELCDKLNA